MYIIGIDPGFSGAWAVIDHNGKYLGCNDLPHDGKKILVQPVIDEVLKCATPIDFIEIVVEDVHAMPGQGVSSTFKFGVAFGGAMAVAERLEGETIFVSPRAWKKQMQLDSDKNLSLEMARQLWPDAPLSRKKDNGRAEALLLAEWRRRQSWASSCLKRL